jgi:hypothetical protein
VEDGVAQHALADRAAASAYRPNWTSTAASATSNAAATSGSATSTRSSSAPASAPQP